MASISLDKTNGTYRIMFAGGNGKWRTLYLGKTTKKAATTIKTRIEEIQAASLARIPLPADTARWLGEIDDTLAGTLADGGLIEARQGEDATATIAEYISGYIAGRTDLRPHTLRNLRRAVSVFIAHVGTEKRLDEFTKADGRAWLVALEAKFAPATSARLLKRTSQFFTNALERELLIRNPFHGIKAPSMKNKDRQHFVDTTTARQVIDAGTSASWRP